MAKFVTIIKAGYMPVDGPWQRGSLVDPTPSYKFSVEQEDGKHVSRFFVIARPLSWFDEGGFPDAEKAVFRCVVEETDAIIDAMMKV